MRVTRVVAQDAVTRARTALWRLCPALRCLCCAMPAGVTRTRWPRPPLESAGAFVAERDCEAVRPSFSGPSNGVGDSRC